MRAAPRARAPWCRRRAARRCPACPAWRARDRACGQAVAIDGDAAAAVVLHAHLHRARLPFEGDPRVRRLRMAGDVGHRFAQDQGEAAFDLGRQTLRRRLVMQVHLRGFEQQPRGREFRREVRRTDAGHRAADFCQGVARDAFGLFQFSQRPGAVAFVQLAGELELEGDQRQRMAEQVVQVPADAFPLGGGGQATHFVVRQLDGDVLLGVGALHVDDDADDQRHRGHPHHGLPRIADLPRLQQEDRVEHRQLRQVTRDRHARAGAQHHAAEHEVAEARRIPGQEREAEHAHRDRPTVRQAPRRQHHLGVQRQEHRIRGRGERGPAPRIGPAAKHRGDEDPQRPQQVHALGPRRLARAQAIGDGRIRRRQETGARQRAQDPLTDRQGRCVHARMLSASALSRPGASAAPPARASPP